MAVAFRSAASAGTSSSSTTLVINKPASVATDDVMIAAIWHPGTAGITPPAGWALVRAGYRLSPNVGRLDVFVRTVDGSEGSTFTFTFPSSTHAAGGISAYSGCDPLTPIDEVVGFSDGAASFTALTHSSLTASRSDGHILAIGGYNASVTSTAPSGYTERFDQQATSAAHSCFMSDKAASSTSIASASTAITSTSLYYSTLHVVLRAANTMGSGSGYATPTQIQKVNATAVFGTSISATYGTTPTSGRLLVACFVSQDWPTITPPAGWTLGASLQGGASAGTGHTEVIYYKISAGTEGTVTFTVNASRNLDLTIFEYSNIVTSSPVDTTGSRNAGTYIADYWSGQITTTQPDLVIYAQGETFNSANQGGPLGNAFTEEYYRAQFARFGSRVVGGSITNLHTTALYPLSDDIVGTNNTSSVLVAFKAAVAGTDVTPSAADTTLAVQAPTPTASADVAATAPAEVLNPEAPTASVSHSAAASAAPLVLSPEAPTLTEGQSANATAPALVLQPEAPTLNYDTQAPASEVPVVFSPEAPTPQTSISVTATAVSFTLIAETASGGIALTATAVGFTLNPESPGIASGTTVFPAGVAFTLQTQLAGLTGATIAPDRTHSPVPPADFITDLLGPLTVITRRAMIYEADGETVWMEDVPILDGSVSVDASRAERRTLSITFDNEAGSLDHSPEGFWYDKVVKVWRGINLNGELWETQLGEFCIDQIQTPHFPDVTQVSGRDYTKRCLTSKLRAATSFAEGQSIEAVIEILATNAGITKFILPNTGQTMGRQFLFDPGTVRWDAMTQIATAFGYELYFNPYGYLVMREYQDPVSSPQQWTFDTGSDTGSIVTFNKTANDTRIYNHIVVRGEATDSPPVWAEAINTNPSSPTRVERIGDRVYEYVSSFFTSSQQCQDVADKFLAIHALESFEVNIESLVLPWLDVSNIVEFIDPDPNPLDPTRFLLSSFEIPLMLGTMTSNAKRVTIVG